MNEVQGCVLNNLIISIIDLIVRNNIENLFGLNKEEGKRKKKKKKEVRSILHFKFAASRLGKRNI